MEDDAAGYMGAVAEVGSSGAQASTATLQQLRDERFNLEGVGKLYAAGGSLPVVFVACNWAAHYWGYPLAASQGRAVYSLANSGDSMIERRYGFVQTAAY